MAFYAGTAGCSYTRHPDGLQWHLESGLNAIELNASFYALPSGSAVMVWRKKTKEKTQDGSSK